MQGTPALTVGEGKSDQVVMRKPLKVLSHIFGQGSADVDHRFDLFFGHDELRLLVQLHRVCMKKNYASCRLLCLNSTMSLHQQFDQAAHDHSTVVLETFHALKHAVRFGAEIEMVVTDDSEKLTELTQTLAPDIAGKFDVETVAPEVFNTLSPRTLESHVIAIAKRSPYALSDILSRDGRIVLLDNPTHAGNVGACIRVVAARGVAGVAILGDIDPWHPTVVRGAAGLQYAVPVVRVDDAQDILSTSRPCIAFHEQGTPLPEATIPNDAILVFGSERRGISPELRTHATQTVMIPMQKGVSSLNLATSVAIALYCTG